MILKEKNTTVGGARYKSIKDGEVPLRKKVNPFPEPGYCLFWDRRDADAATHRVPRRGHGVTAKVAGCCPPMWGGGDCGRGLMLRDMSLAAGGWKCTAVLILQRGTDQPAQPSDIGT